MRLIYSVIAGPVLHIRSRYLNPATGDDSVPAVCTCSRGSRRASRCGRGSPLNRDEGSTGAASKRTIELGATRVASVCDTKHNRVQLPRAIKELSTSTTGQSAYCPSLQVCDRAKQVQCQALSAVVPPDPSRNHCLPNKTRGPGKDTWSPASR